MSDGETVTVGVPVHRGADFVTETLRSIRGQTHEDLTVLMSVDGPDPASEAACRPFLDDPRFRLAVQPRRLGWARNVTWLMDQVETPFWCLQPHDDLLEPTYLETLLAHARTAPEAAIVHSDVAAFGHWEATMSEPSLTGPPLARQLTQLVERHTALAFRGLTRREALREAGGVPINEMDCFSSDVAWVSAAARAGEHHRVPEPLYLKRYHARHEHGRWWSWPEERRVRAWVVHCGDMLEQAMAIDADRAERRLLWAATAGRVVSNRPSPGYLPDWSLTSAGRKRMLDSFLHHVRSTRPLDLPALLGARWGRIRRWARELSLPR